MYQANAMQAADILGKSGFSSSMYEGIERSMEIVLGQKHQPDINSLSGFYLQARFALGFFFALDGAGLMPLAFMAFFGSFVTGWLRPS